MNRVARDITLAPLAVRGSLTPRRLHYEQATHLLERGFILGREYSQLHFRLAQLRSCRRTFGSDVSSSLTGSSSDDPSPQRRVVEARRIDLGTARRGSRLGESWRQTESKRGGCCLVLIWLRAIRE